MTADLPVGRFAAILADPPTEYRTYSNKGKGRSAEAHYDCMPHADICALPVARWAAPDAVLFLWAPRTLLPQTLETIRAWDFQFKSIAFIWAKTIGEPNAQPSLLGPAAPRFWMGMGHWTRAGCELCLLATRGRPHRINADVRELILAPRREHSRKPDGIYPLIERLVGGPYLELFASAEAPHRDGWTRWVGKDRAPERRWGSDSYPGAARP